MASDDDSRTGTVPGGNLSYVIRDAHRSFSRALQARVGRHNVSMAQWFFLRALWEENGLTQRELSQRVGMMEPTTVAAVNTMERRGLVRRSRNEHDRRKVNIHLTELGASLRVALADAGDLVNAMAVDGIEPDEVVRAVELLQRVVLNLAAVVDAGAAPAADDEDLLAGS